MRHAHPAGERMFVDYAFQTVDVIDPRHRRGSPGADFRRGAGHLQLHLRRGDPDQSVPDWIAAHVRALASWAAPAQLVPDNPKVGIDRANWYEPGLNRTYLDLATHYGSAILPTRTRKPRERKVEVAVLVVECWILARLWNRRFLSLAELNRAIAELVAALNARPMRRLGVSRSDLLVELDCPALKELPAEPYEYAEMASPPGRARFTLAISTAITTRSRIG
jgi:transposase